VGMVWLVYGGSFSSFVFGVVRGLLGILPARFIASLFIWRSYSFLGLLSLDAMMRSFLNSFLLFILCPMECFTQL
jgi:hypothetical protein